MLPSHKDTEKRLWSAADERRAKSRMRIAEFFTPTSILCAASEKCKNERFVLTYLLDML